MDHRKGDPDYKDQEADCLMVYDHMYAIRSCKKTKYRSSFRWSRLFHKARDMAS